MYMPVFCVCHCAGLPSMRHNDIRDVIADILTEICRANTPLTGEQLQHQTANRGWCESRYQCPSFLEDQTAACIFWCTSNQLFAARYCKWKLYSEGTKKRRDGAMNREPLNMGPSLHWYFSNRWLGTSSWLWPTEEWQRRADNSTVGPWTAFVVFSVCLWSVQPFNVSRVPDQPITDHADITWTDSPQLKKDESLATK